MGLADLLAVLDKGGALVVSVIAIVLMLRLERILGKLGHATAILVERTRGLRVIRQGRRVTVTLEPPPGEEGGVFDDTPADPPTRT